MQLIAPAIIYPLRMESLEIIISFSFYILYSYIKNESAMNYKNVYLYKFLLFLAGIHHDSGTDMTHSYLNISCWHRHIY